MSDTRSSTTPLKVCEIISCSRRTDIPAFKMAWVLDQIRAGAVAVANPHNRSQVSHISLSRNDVRCWAWWSKDYAEWIKTYEDPTTGPLLRQYAAHVFNFTINGRGNGHNPLEPGLCTSLDQRLEELAWLAAHFGPDSIILRFDPIVHYRTIEQGRYVERPTYAPDGTTVPPDAHTEGANHFITNNLQDFARITQFATILHIRFMVVAFAIIYPHVEARLRKHKCADGTQIELANISHAQQRALLVQMRDFARSCAPTPEATLQIRLCCLPGFDDIEDIGVASCVDGAQINGALERAGAPPLATGSLKKDPGQRDVCHCAKSIDIAGYGPEFACDHSCVYCYANPKS